MKKNLNNLSSQVSDKTPADKFLILFSVFFSAQYAFFSEFPSQYSPLLCKCKCGLGLAGWD